MKENAVMTLNESPMRDGYLLWTFRDGGEVKFTLRAMLEGERESDYMAYIHGCTQKIADRAAIARDKKTGASATQAEKRAAMQETAENLANGIWNTRGTGAKTEAIDEDLVRAICEIRQKTAGTVRDWLKGMTPAQRGAIGALPEFLPRLEEIKKKRLESIDVTALVAGLDAL